MADKECVNHFFRIVGSASTCRLLPLVRGVGDAAVMRRILSLAALSCAAFATASAACATSVPDGEDNRQRHFLITVGDRSADLDCLRTGGRPACVALERVGGDPSRLPAREGVACAMDYHPVAVSAVGIWDGRPYRYKRTFSNSCELATATGPVFRI
jgi:hypothetical protein